MGSVEVAAEAGDGFYGVVIFNNQFLCQLHSLHLCKFKTIIPNMFFKCSFEFGGAHACNDRKLINCVANSKVAFDNMPGLFNAFNIIGVQQGQCFILKISISFLLLYVHIRYIIKKNFVNNCCS